MQLTLSREAANNHSAARAVIGEVAENLTGYNLIAIKGMNKNRKNTIWKALGSMILESHQPLHH